MSKSFSSISNRPPNTPQRLNFLTNNSNTNSNIENRLTMIEQKIDDINNTIATMQADIDSFKFILNYMYEKNTNNGLVITECLEISNQPPP